jgi:hypothetical protein
VLRQPKPIEGTLNCQQPSRELHLAPVELRGSAFGLLAAVQSFGNLAASAIAGLLWTAASPAVAFGYLAGWMAIVLVGLLATARSRSS